MLTIREDVTRLGRLVHKRRVRLRLSQTEAAKRARVSRPTWDRVETGSGKAYPVSYAGIEDVLGWEPGSCQEILAGGDPVLVGQGSSRPERTEADELIEKVQRSEWARTTKELVIAAIRLAEDAERERSSRADSA